jgi:hypothetical protein
MKGAYDISQVLPQAENIMLALHFSKHTKHAIPADDIVSQQQGKEAPASTGE